MNAIKHIILKELTRVFKDKKMVFSLFILPPIMIVGMYSLMGSVMSNFMSDVEKHIPYVYIQNAPEDFDDEIKAANYNADITYIKASEKLDTLYSFLGNQDLCDNYKIIQKLNNCLEMLKPIDVKESNKIEKRNKYFDRNWSWKNSEDQMKRKVLAMRKKGL
jgi:hypothetical protein